MPTTSSSRPELFGTKPASGWFSRVIVITVLVGAAPRLSAQTPTHDMHDEHLSASESGAAPRFVLSGFGDAAWQKTDEPGEANTFSLGQFTLYPTATLTDKLSMLAEIVFEGGSDNSIRVDVERVLLRYSFAD